MSMYKYVRELWKKPKETMPELFRERLILWRRQPSTVRIERPTRIDRARSLGYKAKQGILVVRQRVIRGGHSRVWTEIGGRRSKHSSPRMDLRKNYQQIAEERANKKFKNCEVLNSYLVAKDGTYIWHEVILVDRSSPGIVKDPRFSWLNESQHKGRVFRGLTSAGRKSRGLYHKGKGSEKARPSRRANSRKL